MGIEFSLNHKPGLEFNGRNDELLVSLGVRVVVADAPRHRIADFANWNANVFVLHEYPQALVRDVVPEVAGKGFKPENALKVDARELINERSVVIRELQLKRGFFYMELHFPGDFLEFKECLIGFRLCVVSAFVYLF